MKIRSAISTRPRAVLEADPKGKHFYNDEPAFSGLDKRGAPRRRIGFDLTSGNRAPLAIFIERLVMRRRQSKMGRMKEDSEDSRLEEVFAQLAGRISQATGSFWTFSAALGIVVVWGATGPLFDYSQTWQLVINTGTTIVTFLMVFVIQHAQNKDMRAVQLKLNELIAAVEGASNRLIDVEDLSDRELEHLYKRFRTLADSAQKLSHGAKLTIDSSDYELETPHQHNPRSP